MSILFSEDDLRVAANLVLHGLQPRTRPAGNARYAELVNRYHESSVIQTATRIICDEWSLSLLQVDLMEGVILGATRHSPFAYSITDFRAKTNLATNAKIIVGYCAIIATLFPTSESIDEQPETLTTRYISDVVKLLIAILRELSDRYEAGTLEADLHEVWRELNKMSPDIIKSATAKRDRPNLKTLEGMIRSMVKPMVDNGLLAKSDDPNALVARERMRLHLQYLTARKLLEFVRGVTVTPDIRATVDKYTTTASAESADSTDDDQSDDI